MTKRILEIVTFPFFLLLQVISFPFKMVKIVLDDKKENEREIENFLEKKLRTRVDWTNVNKLRNSAEAAKQQSKP